jgi:hypothetical protein
LRLRKPKPDHEKTEAMSGQLLTELLIFSLWFHSRCSGWWMILKKLATLSHSFF